MTMKFFRKQTSHPIKSEQSVEVCLDRSLSSIGLLKPSAKFFVILAVLVSIIGCGGGITGQVTGVKPKVVPAPTPMPTLNVPGAVLSSVPTPFPDRDLFGMPLHVNGTPLEPHQDAFAIPCGFITFDPPANEKGRYYRGTKIAVTVHRLNSGTKAILGVANSSEGNAPTGTIYARNAEPYSITAQVAPCSSPVTITSYNTYNPAYYLLVPTPMPTSTLPPLTPRPYSETSNRQYLSDGQRLYNLGQFDAAFLELDQAITLSQRMQPLDRQEAYTWRAKSHVALGNWREALLDVGEALAINPTDVEGYRKLGDAYKTLNVELFRLRAAIYMELNSHEGAILAFNQVISRDPAPTAGDYHSRGYAHYMHEQYFEAIRDLTESILIEPTRERFELRGASYYYSGQDILKVQYERALSDFNQAIRMHSTSNLIEWKSFTHSKLDQFNLVMPTPTVTAYPTVTVVPKATAVPKPTPALTGPKATAVPKPTPTWPKPTPTPVKKPNRHGWSGYR